MNEMKCLILAAKARFFASLRMTVGPDIHFVRRS